MKPRSYVAPKPLNTQPNPRKSKETMVLEKARKAHEARRNKTQRELLIEAGIITPRKRR